MLRASHQSSVVGRPRHARRPIARVLASILAVACGFGVCGTPAAMAQPAVVGQWAGPFAWPFAASHAALLPNGRVLVWNDLGQLPQIWNPATGAFASAAAPDTLQPGAAEIVLRDGRVLFLGGHVGASTGAVTVQRFGVTGNVWQTLPSLITGRDGATAIVLGDGRALAIGGDVASGIAADTPELAVPGSSWLELVNAPRALPRRSWVFQVSTGAVAVVGPERSTRLLDVSGTGDWSLIGDMILGSRDGGTAVLVPGFNDRLLLLGGRSPATATCEILDLPTSMSWRATTAMRAARRHHNATLLANGTVLVTGGTLVGDEQQYAVYAAESFNPINETWTDLDSMSVPRRLGSVALLLPDARVLVAGGGTGAVGSELHADAEIFSPPYLFKGARPVVTTAPDSVVYGNNFVIATPDDSIAAVWVVRAGAVSGGFNADQRALALGFTVQPGQLTASAPANTNAAPPGPYLLFLVHMSGAPSVGRFVRFYTAPPPVDLPVITSTPPAAASVGAQYVYGPTATGSGPITWSLPVAPAWLSVNTANGIVTGIPTAEQAFNVTLRATNAAGHVDQTWNITATGTARKVIAIGATWRYFKGTTNPGSTWANLDFVDSGWLQGPSGFGFGDGDDATVLADMQGLYSTIYTRCAFTVYEKQSVTRLAIQYDYDDGFAVYLNGTRIFALAAPGTITNTSLATSSHEATHVFARQEITTASTLALLQEGQNVLAVVGLNNSLTSNDVTLRIELELTGGADVPVDAVPVRADGRDWVFPNPFQDSTTFHFGMAQPGTARLDLFDVRGRRLRTLLAPSLGPGAHVVEWDGRDLSGQGVVPGVYFYRLTTPAGERRGKLVKSLTLR